MGREMECITNALAFLSLIKVLFRMGILSIPEVYGMAALL